MKIGTLRCWLFGHIFVGDFYDREMIVNRRAIKNCRRCGIEKPATPKANQ